MKEIFERFGHSLYWTGCALAAVVFFASIKGGAGAIGLAAAFLIWLVGRTFRYILADT
jgi:hypothetical protein